MNTQAREFIGKKRPNYGLYTICFMPIFTATLLAKNSSELLYTIPIGLTLAALLYYFSPKYQPKKFIRISDKSLAMYEDNAINWHVPLAKIKRADIQPRGVYPASLAYVLRIFEDADEQLIDQDVTFLSVEQHKELLASLEASCCG